MLSTTDYKKALRQYLKATKNRPSDIDQDWTPFRAAEKKYKARFPPVDLSSVLDLACRDPSRRNEIETGVLRGSSDAIEAVQICGDEHTLPAFIVPKIPGLVILPGFVSHSKQRELVRWALADHARPPNDNNLDTHYNLPPSGLWNTWLKARVDPDEDLVIQPKTTSLEAIDNAPSGPRKLVNNEPASPETFEAISKAPKPPIPPSPTVQALKASSLVPKLRWANIGWYYHWGTKQYDFSKGKVEVDSDLRILCKEAVRSVPWEKVHGTVDEDWGTQGPDWDSWEEIYEPDAGIVNFYQEKDTLMAHVDRSEVCATSPLVSISLGNAAIFLIGGLTRESEPVPILLRSGDVVIMSGPSCRRAYHGVPRILGGTLGSHLKVEDDSDWEAYEEYLTNARININVRQVFPKGFRP